MEPLVTRSGNPLGGGRATNGGITSAGGGPRESQPRDKLSGIRLGAANHADLKAFNSAPGDVRRAVDRQTNIDCAGHHGLARATGGIATADVNFGDRVQAAAYGRAVVIRGAGGQGAPGGPGAAALDIGD